MLDWPTSRSEDRVNSWQEKQRYTLMHGSFAYWPLYRTCMFIRQSHCHWPCPWSSCIVPRVRRAGLFNDGWPILCSGDEPLAFSAQPSSCSGEGDCQEVNSRLRGAVQCHSPRTWAHPWLSCSALCCGLSVSLSLWGLFGWCWATSGSAAGRPTGSLRPFSLSSCCTNLGWPFPVLGVTLYTSISI